MQHYYATTLLYKFHINFDLYIELKNNKRPGWDSNPQSQKGNQLSRLAPYQLGDPGIKTKAFRIKKFNFYGKINPNNFKKQFYP